MDGMDLQGLLLQLNHFFAVGAPPVGSLMSNAVLDVPVALLGVEALKGFFIFSS